VERDILDDRTMTQYLLGLLPEEERTRVEQSFFQSDSCFEQLTALEDDLIDDYVRGNLAGPLRSAFEEKLQSDPRWKKRVVFAQALAQRAKKTERIAPNAAEHRGHRGFWQPWIDAFRSWPLAVRAGIAAASVLLTISVPWLAWDAWQGRQQPEQLEARQPAQPEIQASGTPPPAPLPERPAPPQTAPPNKGGGAASLVASFVLTPGVTRGVDDVTRVQIPAGADSVRLQLDLDSVGEYPGFRAELRTRAGRLVWSGASLKALTIGSGKAVIIDLQPTALESGEHEMALFGQIAVGKYEEAGFYYFNVQR
jgi:hypothetical protein